MMKTMSIAVVAMAGLAVSASADINPFSGSTLNGAEGLYDSIVGQTDRSPVPGDTYDAHALVQDAGSAYFIDDVPDFHSFGGGEFAGDNFTGNAGDTFGAFSAHTVLGGGTELVQVEMANFDVAGNLSAWVAAGVTGPAGPFTAWRMDVGTITGSDPIAWSADFTVINSGFTAFDSAGNALGTFALTVDGSTANSLAGVAVVGLSGADIAGFDMASIQMFWEIEKVPAPGAMALLGLGGLVATRRRR